MNTIVITIVVLIVVLTIGCYSGNSEKYQTGASLGHASRSSLGRASHVRTFTVPLYDNITKWVNQTIQFGNNSVPEETLLIYYYTPWCVNCISFNTHWKQLKEYYKDSARVLLIDIDCEKNPLVSQLANIGQYPTLRIIRGSRVIEYPHNRSMTFEGITHFLRTRSV